MRVLFLSVHLGQAGTTTHLVALAEGLTRAGCEVAIASQQRGNAQIDTGRRLEQEGIRCYSVNFPTVYRRFAENAGRTVRSVMDLLRIVGDFKPDIIHVQWRSLSGYAQFIRVLRSIPFVTTLNAQSVPSDFLHRVFSFWGACAIAISRDTHEVLQKKFRLDPKRLQVIHYGCDTEHFRPPSDSERKEARHSLEVGEHDHVASIVARLSPEKRHEVAVRAIADLRRKGRDVHLLLAGAPYSTEVTPQSLMRQATDEGAADLVHVLGHTDARSVLWASDLTILPSRFEGLSSAIIEGMLCGVVPIRTPAGGATDQIENGHTGFIIPFDDHLALSASIERLISDRVLHQRMSEAALCSAREKFSLDQMITKTMQVYKTILAD
jgi:glycosyltransferase involved in cell wall biosynthesis